MINPPGQSHSAGPRTEFRRTNEGMHIGQQEKGLLEPLVPICQLAKLVDQEDDYIRHFTQSLWFKITVLKYCVELRWAN